MKLLHTLFQSNPKSCLDDSLCIAQSFSRPLSKMLCLVFFMGLSVLHLQAQCPSPTATTAPVTTNNPTSGATTTSISSGSVTYVTGNVILGTSNLAYTVTISSGTTWVISAGSHLTVTNLNVAGTLIIQAGATVSVVGLTSANGSFGVSAGGIVKMCENSGIENCGTTTFTPSPSLSYVGSSGGKAVARFANKSASLAGSLTMPFLAPATSASSEITIATPPTSALFTQSGSAGSALTCTIGSNCGTLPFDVNGSCGSFANVCTAGTTAPTLTATTKSNTCPTTTVDLTTITATNLPSGTTLTWHTATPATTGNKVTGTAVAAGTYYAAFFDASGDCYSGTSGAATTTVTATVAACITCMAGSTAPLFKQ